MNNVEGTEKLAEAPAAASREAWMRARRGRLLEETERTRRSDGRGGGRQEHARALHSATARTNKR